MLSSELIGLVLDIGWTWSCCHLYQGGIRQKVDRVSEGHAAVSISLVLDIGWTGSCCRLCLSGIGHRVDRVSGGHAAVSTDQPGVGHKVDKVSEGHAAVSISLVLEIGWTRSCCRLNRSAWY